MLTIPIGKVGAPPADFLYFDFPAGWEAIEFDRDNHLPTGQTAGFYRRSIVSKGLQHIRAMDIVARPPQELRLVLVEVKDDRKRGIPTKERHNDLWQSVLQKALGTLATLTIAESVGDMLTPAPHKLTPQLLCLSQKPKIQVVLFLVELPVPPAPVVVGATKAALRRGNKALFRSDLELRLTAKLHTWDMTFQLFNLTNRPPAEWSVR